MAVTEKKTFSVQYKARATHKSLSEALFGTSTFSTSIKGKDEDEARDYFEKYYPKCQIVSITEENQ